MLTATFHVKRGKGKRVTRSIYRGEIVVISDKNFLLYFVFIFKTFCFKFALVSLSRQAIIIVNHQNYRRDIYGEKSISYKA